MLAWWTVFPALLLLGTQLTLGVASARAKAGDPNNEYLIGFAAGSVVVALGMALFAAWVAYRASDRRQLPGSLTFLCVSVFLSLATLQNWSREQDALRLTTYAGPASFGSFSVEVPEGWIIGEPQGSRTVALLLLPGRVPSEPSGMILVEAAPTEETSAEAAAKALTVHGGRVAPEPVLLDGVTAFRYDGSSNDFSKPRHALALVREGKAYIIQAAGIESVDVAVPFERVLTTWRWSGPG